MYLATSGEMYLVNFQASSVYAVVWLVISEQMKLYFAYEWY